MNIFRTTGKFTYQLESSYSVGTVGYEDVDCDSIDHTYIRTSSSSLDSFLRSGVANFAEELKRTAGPGHKAGQISLEFFQRKRTRWPFPPENIPWEVKEKTCFGSIHFKTIDLHQVWTVRLEIISLANETERLGWREKLGEVLCEKTLYICEVMNKEEFVPKMPNQSDLDLVFDSNFHDVQPHLFKVCHSTASVDNTGVTGVNTVRRLLKDTLAI